MIQTAVIVLFLAWLGWRVRLIEQKLDAVLDERPGGP